MLGWHSLFRKVLGDANKYSSNQPFHVPRYMERYARIHLPGRHKVSSALFEMFMAGGWPASESNNAVSAAMAAANITIPIGTRLPRRKKSGLHRARRSLVQAAEARDQPATRYRLVIATRLKAFSPAVENSGRCLRSGPAGAVTGQCEFGSSAKALMLS